MSRLAENLNAEALLRLRAVELAIDAGAKPGAINHAANEVLDFILSSQAQQSSLDSAPQANMPRKSLESFSDQPSSIS